MRGVREAKGSGCHHRKSPKEGKFTLDIRFFIFFFSVRAMKHWHRLPRDVVGAPSLETLKVRLDRALRT